MGNILSKFPTRKIVLKEKTASTLGAQKVWFDALRYLGIAIESMITTLSPEVIVFGGGVSQAGTKLIEPIQSFLEERLTFQRHPKLEIAKFGKFAGTIGCAMLAFDLVNP